MGCLGSVEFPVPAGVKQTLRTQHSGLFRLGHTSVVLQVRIQDGKLGAESGNDLGSRDLGHPELVRGTGQEGWSLMPTWVLEHGRSIL